jgi:hypothetical protein
LSELRPATKPRQTGGAPPYMWGVFHSAPELLLRATGEPTDLYWHARNEYGPEGPGSSFLGGLKDRLQGGEGARPPLASAQLTFLFPFP